MKAKALLVETQALDEKLGALQDKLINLKVRANEDSLKFPLGVDGDLADLAIITGGDADAAPTAAAVDRFAKVKEIVDGYQTRWNNLVANDLPKVQKIADQQNVHVLILKPPPAN